MKVRVRRAGPGDKVPTVVAIETEFIRLDALLKFAAVVQTGGEAKLIITDGLVKLNGETCTQRGRKIHPGDIVTYEDNAFKVVAAVQAGGL